MNKLKLTPKGKAHRATLKALESNIQPYLSALPEREREDAESWYHTAHDFAVELSEDTGIPLVNVCQVIAVLSPAVAWETNMKDATNLCRGFANGHAHDVVVSTYGQNKRKAIAILIGDTSLEPTAQKTYAFYMNIMHPDRGEYVTVDRHAYKALLGDNNGGRVYLPVTQYRAAAVYYTALAERYGLTPVQLQAVVWTGYKAFNGR